MRQMADPTQTDAPERFTIEQIVAESGSRFDQPSWAMAGALHGYRNDTITEKEAQKRLDTFLKREAE